MRIGLYKTIGAASIVGATLFTASSALAATTWERTTTVTGPEGNTATYTTDRTCGVRGCKTDWTVTNSDGDSKSFTTYRRAWHR